MQGSSGLPESVEALRGFIDAPSLDDKIEHVRTHPYLMSDASLEFLDLLKEQMIKAGDTAFAETLATHRALLSRARQVGLTQACDELRHILLTQTVQEFVMGRSWMDSYIYLGKHPELKSERAIEILTAIETDARAGGNTDLAKGIATHVRLLRRVQDIGAEPAFIEVGGMDFLTSRPPAQD
jgi:hypothetical protein